MLQERGKRRAGIAQAGQPDQVSAQLLQRGLADAVLLVLRSVVASLVRCHQDLSLNREIAQSGLLPSTVGDERRVPAGEGRPARALTAGRWHRDRGRQCRPRLAIAGSRRPPVSAGAGAELAGVDAEGAAVVELVALGDAALAFPAVDVVQHAVELGHGRVAGVARRPG